MPPMNQTAATLLSVAMLAGFAMIVIGTRFALTPEHRRNGGLTVLVGIIIIANVLVLMI
ncbi:hypothetical protein GCM10022280_13920 [Sphingomonas swuensis]|uniref:Uncharacterized protein n=2 Tax=Sphingomonas swuensis TaxID=977800 RepID=A0ABP7STK4_9SPHN